MLAEGLIRSYTLSTNTPNLPPIYIFRLCLFPHHDILFVHNHFIQPWLFEFPYHLIHKWYLGGVESAEDQARQ